LISENPEFSGFKKDGLKFLGQLEKEKNNNLIWFSKNRNRYQDNIVQPAKSFVTAIGQFFNHLNPSIRTEPKFNKTLMRINKDMRFSKGIPYKTYFLIHFGRFKMDSEFYVYLYKNGIQYGIFLNNSVGDDLYLNDNLTKYRKELIAACKEFKINNKFTFYELHKTPELVMSSFNASKNFDMLPGKKYILLEKEIALNNKLIYSPDFLSEAIKTFSNLYPLYCFAISPNPLKLIDDFEDRMGIAV